MTSWVNQLRPLFGFRSISGISGYRPYFAADTISRSIFASTRLELP